MNTRGPSAGGKIRNKNQKNPRRCKTAIEPHYARKGGHAKKGGQFSRSKGAFSSCAALTLTPGDSMDTACHSPSPPDPPSTVTTLSPPGNNALASPRPSSAPPDFVSVHPTSTDPSSSVANVVDRHVLSWQRSRKLLRTSFMDLAPVSRYLSGFWRSSLTANLGEIWSLHGNFGRPTSLTNRGV